MLNSKTIVGVCREYHIGVACNRQMLSVSYNAYVYGEDQSNN